MDINGQKYIDQEVLAKMDNGDKKLGNKMPG